MDRSKIDSLAWLDHIELLEKQKALGKIKQGQAAKSLGVAQPVVSVYLKLGACLDAKSRQKIRESAQRTSQPYVLSFSSAKELLRLKAVAQGQWDAALERVLSSHCRSVQIWNMAEYLSKGYPLEKIKWLERRRIGKLGPYAPKAETASLKPSDLPLKTSPESRVQSPESEAPSQSDRIALPQPWKNTSVLPGSRALTLDSPLPHHPQQRDQSLPSLTIPKLLIETSQESSVQSAELKTPTQASEITPQNTPSPSDSRPLTPDSKLSLPGPGTQNSKHPKKRQVDWLHLLALLLAGWLVFRLVVAWQFHPQYSFPGLLYEAFLGLSPADSSSPWN